MTKYFFFFILGLSLCACQGSDDKNNTTEPQENETIFVETYIAANEAIYGEWYNDFFDIYLIISSREIQKIYTDPEYNCKTEHISLDVLTYYPHTVYYGTYEAMGELEFEVLDENRIVLQGEDTDNPGDLEYVRTEYSSDGLPFCESSGMAGTLHAQLNFIELPELVSLNHAQSSLGEVEFSIDITFDVNRSGIIDAGDLTFRSRYFKTDTDAPPKSVPIDSLSTYLWLEQGNGITSTIEQADFALTNGSVSFSIPRSVHPGIREIDNSTQVYVNVFYAEPNGNTIRDWYPEQNEYTIGVDTSLQEDATGDVTGNNEGLFDLTQIIVEIQ